MQLSVQGVPSAPPTPVDNVLHALMDVGRLMRQRIQSDGVDPGTFWLLKFLGEQGAMRVTELAALACLDPSTVSRHVTQLERDGLSTRTPDPEDGRAQLVELSEAGRRHLHDALARRRARLTRILERWDSADLATLEALLGRFVTDIENFDPDLEQQ